jgi:hypothetical protein
MGRHGSWGRERVQAPYSSGSGGACYKLRWWGARVRVRLCVCVCAPASACASLHELLSVRVRQMLCAGDRWQGDAVSHAAVPAKWQWRTAAPAINCNFLCRGCSSHSCDATCPISMSHVKEMSHLHDTGM